MGNMPLAENNWVGLLAWFPTPGRLQDGLCSFLDSSVRLTRRLGLGTTLSSGWSCEVTALFWQSSKTGPSTYMVLWGPESGKSVLSIVVR